MTNSTAVKFGFPETLVGENRSWWVLVRPKQPTFGSLVLICKEEARAFAEISAEAFLDLQGAVRSIETLLARAVGYEKINYLMLMMLDPDVHFHVVPRYAGERMHEGMTFADSGWPGAPDLATAVDLGAEGAARLAQTLRRDWPSA